jgi:hypothetical protein
VANKINVLLRLESAPWNTTIRLRSERQKSKRDEPFYGHVATAGSPTDDETRLAAVQVAKALREQSVRYVDDGESAPSSPEAETADTGDALGVS